MRPDVQYDNTDMLLGLLIQKNIKPKKFKIFIFFIKPNFLLSFNLVLFWFYFGFNLVLFWFSEGFILV